MTSTTQEPKEAVKQAITTTKFVMEPLDLSKRVPAAELAKIPMAVGKPQTASGSGVPKSDVAIETHLDKKTGVQTISFYSPEIGYGSGANNCNYAAKVYLSSDGTCRFTGHYQNTGSIPIFPAPTQQFGVTMAIKAKNNVVFCFSTTGYANSAPQAMSYITWDHTTHNAAVKANFQEILAGWSWVSHSNNQVNFGGILGLLGDIWNAIESVIGDVEKVINVASFAADILA